MRPAGDRMRRIDLEGVTELGVREPLIAVDDVRLAFYRGWGNGWAAALAR